jgi:hypothetical protein
MDVWAFQIGEIAPGDRSKNDALPILPTPQKLAIANGTAEIAAPSFCRRADGTGFTFDLSLCSELERYPCFAAKQKRRERGQVSRQSVEIGTGRWVNRFRPVPLFGKCFIRAFAKRERRAFQSLSERSGYRASDSRILVPCLPGPWGSGRFQRQFYFRDRSK